jgi:hypothetical protein
LCELCGNFRDGLFHSDDAFQPNDFF